MPNPRSRFVDLGEHELHVREWGPPGAPALVMWHGLARTGRDFDRLAGALCDRYHILCPDTIGRGLSSWSSAPDRDYTLPTYAAHAVAILDACGIGRCDWIGTSMGAALGIGLAVGPLADRIGRLVLNDFGPAIPAEALDRIRAYVTQPPVFTTLRAMESYLRQIYAPFGALDDEEWRRMTVTSARRRDDGRLTLHYDPAVMAVVARQSGGVDLWGLWDRLTCPCLVLRGETSDLLTAEVADEMTRRGPSAQRITVPGCGHAPALNTPDQIAAVRDFLAR